MSSNYYVICVSHDPAIVIDIDYRTPAEVLAAAAGKGGHEQLRQHLTCDLVVGRYSYPLIEASCPGGPSCPGRHRYDVRDWTDAGWLRLLHAAYLRDDDLTAMGLRRCWTRDRVLRLAAELGIAPSTPEEPA